MKISEYTKEMMNEHSFIDMAYLYLLEKGKDQGLYDIIDEFKKIGDYNDDEIETRVVQFYTDLNTDGRFLSTGENVWGLRDWYSVDDIEEKIAPTVQKFEVLDEDEDDANITLLGEVEVEDELDLVVEAGSDEENLEDPEDEDVEDELDQAGLVVEEDEFDEEDEDEFDEEDEEETL
ncbi:DNA-directed RNA polymerase subunit delta [Macrococcus hajekii]|uniref:Probable DNA-directed RNA polymerase subunit delta n=1 Tax=Macrococcus hajekii TaxID=198482 RepID=A0A4R6BHR5_9STAP|nr:DNA-directed RNA polymerase subunit delta [Macrococcus hajekii]TDM01127.1 DNA-directed RNA polymerase subunit delta [Macrococcus hajekii]GGB12241.1 putative DNA-directed RNA polymerase subunit delta [Macrococcus hajekii]